MSVIDTLKGATPNRKTVTICVDGALQARWDALSNQLTDASHQDAKAGSLALENTTRVVDEMEKIRDQVAASEVSFTFQSMPWEARISLQAEHPPREKNLVDRIRGFNVATFYPALLKAACVSIAGADGDEVTELDDEVWAGLLGDGEVGGSLNLGQVDVLTAAASAVNDQVSAVPPSARSLLGSRDSGASLAQPSPGTSPREGSKAGSRRTSRKSSTTKKAPSKARSAGT